MPSSAGKRQLSVVRVLGHPLADADWLAGHVEQVVGDLKCQAHVSPYA